MLGGLGSVWRWEGLCRVLGGFGVAFFWFFVFVFSVSCIEGWEDWEGGGLFVGVGVYG